MLCACGCGRPLDRERAEYHTECVPRVKREIMRRWQRSPRGRAQRRTWATTPAVKIVRSLYRDTHRDEINRYHREWRARRRVPVTVECATLLCERRFVRGPNQGRRRFCDDCLAFFYGPAKVATRAAQVAA